MRNKLKKIEDYARVTDNMSQENLKSMKNVKRMLDKVAEKKLADSVYQNVQSSKYGNVPVDRVSFGKYSVHMSQGSKLCQTYQTNER